MIALNLFNFFIIISNINDVLTYRQNRPHIMTPTNQQSGNSVPNQGNITAINFMFPPVNSINISSGNKEISTSISANEALPLPAVSQTYPTNLVSTLNNNIPPTNSTIVTSIATSRALTPSSGESQITPTNPVFKQDEIASSMNPIVTSPTSTQPTATEVVINPPTNGSSFNFTVQFPVSINIVIASNDDGHGLTTNRPLELSTVSENNENSNTIGTEIPAIYPSTSESSISTMTENPLSSSSTIGSSVENITSVTIENSITIMSENSITTVSTVELVTEYPVSTISEIVTTPPDMVLSTNEIDIENPASPGTTGSTATTPSTNPTTFQNTSGSAVSSLSANSITTPSTNEKIVQFLTENPVNINVSDPAPNGNNFVFTTPSSAAATTAPSVRASTVNVDLSDGGQNGINFGSVSSGSQNDQSNMIYERKCEEYYNMGSRTVRTTRLQVFIVGGTSSLPNEFPHMAALGYRHEPNEWLCGGSLISENYVVTAAHCLSSSTLGEIQFVRLGATFLQTETLDSEDYNVIRRIPYPAYTAGMQYNDIALLQLDRPVTFSESIRPICLSSPNMVIAQKSLIATGWGKTEPAGDVSPELQKVDLEYFPNNECQQAYAVVSQQDLPRGIDDNTQICAGSRNEQKDTCQGDSGGPLQIEENGRFYLVGITSFGINCGKPGSPGVYTRVSYYIPWIEQIVWANEQ